MSAQATPSVRPRSLVGRLFRWTLGVVAAILAALFLTVLVEWGGLTFFWADEGASRSAAILREDIAWLQGAGVEPVVLPLVTIPAPAEFAAGMSVGLYRALFVWTGMEAVIGWLSNLSALGAVYLEATMNSIRIFFIRLAITITALPLFLLCAWWGVMEGLVRRDLRRFGGDLEHGMVYHWAKHLAGATLAVPAFLYLAWPDSINPAWLFTPFALALGLNIMIVSATFTKYV